MPQLTDERGAEPGSCLGHLFYSDRYRSKSPPIDGYHPGA
jgi:hypothetical protein